LKEKNKNSRLNALVQGAASQPDGVVYAKDNGKEGWHKIKDIELPIKIGGVKRNSFEDILAYLVDKDIENTKNIKALKDVASIQNKKIIHLERMAKKYGYDN